FGVFGLFVCVGVVLFFGVGFVCVFCFLFGGCVFWFGGDGLVVVVLGFLVLFGFGCFVVGRALCFLLGFVGFLGGRGCGGVCCGGGCGGGGVLGVGVWGLLCWLGLFWWGVLWCWWCVLCWWGWEVGLGLVGGGWWRLVLVGLWCCFGCFCCGLGVLLLWVVCLGGGWCWWFWWWGLWCGCCVCLFLCWCGWGLFWVCCLV
ncbi:hypothetical protein, partial [Pseudomonas syringae group genomosp. 7]|uniref:hypothetical protein n=1 Tax=Pseudomonas syringae group genomosp. 7 TaxID=251699 RepID=UPI0037706E7D